jgi:hypothetical protein
MPNLKIELRVRLSYAALRGEGNQGAMKARAASTAALQEEATSNRSPSNNLLWRILFRIKKLSLPLPVCSPDSLTTSTELLKGTKKVLMK